mmetsp:Transcript_575/g.733  ORF Transcript_575/g.733 Transcript_575/m.733 type:complete len:143 (-) Transcript_575:67-495(-)
MYSIGLEQKSCNHKLKRLLLTRLQDSIEDVLMQRRELEIKATLQQTINELNNITVPKINYRGRYFDSIDRWVIYFLGSLRSIQDFYKYEGSLSVNIIIVIMCEEHIDSYEINKLKDMVANTRQGGLMIIRHEAGRQAQSYDK